jgi:hypothetical protein
MDMLRASMDGYDVGHVWASMDGHVWASMDGYAMIGLDLGC